MKEELEKSILECNFKKAYEIFIKLAYEEAKDLLLKISFDNGSMQLYAFLRFLIDKKQTAQYHFLASVILSTGMCWMEGAYAVGLYHLRKALELDSEKADFLLYMLFYYTLPEDLISLEEAKSFAKKLLSYEPDNEVAQEILNKKA